MLVQMMQTPVRRNRMVPTSLIGVKVKVLKIWNPKEEWEKDSVLEALPSWYMHT
jgi:hypothetical protein